MNINLPGGIAMISIVGEAITLNTPVDAQPQNGVTSVTVDPSVTQATILNTIAMLTAVATQMAA